MRPLIGNATRSALAAGLGGLAAAALDASWAVSSGAEADWGVVWLADVGLVAPFALAVGLLVAAASVFLHGTDAPSLERQRRRLQDAPSEQRAHVSALLVTATLGTLIWLVATANAGSQVLSFVEPARAAGIALGAAAAALFCVTYAVVLGAARILALFWAARPPDALRVALGCTLIFLAAVGAFVAAGTTSGTGGLLAVFGVFKRMELDLRAPALLLSIALVAYVAPGFLRRVSWWAAALAALVPLLAVPRAAAGALEERRVALALERGAPLGKVALALLRKATDRDRDGFSGAFGGGDCDDGNASRNPNAEDVPGNGIDEDCSGADDRLIKLERAAPEAPKDMRGWVAAKLPAKPNVVVITVDTLRYDVGYAGNPRPVSPNIDALAEKSAIFERGYALASYTSKSLPPMLIGKYASETHRGWNHFNRFGKQDVFIQERLQKVGIRTLSVQGYWYFFNPGIGFERGFDVIDSSAAPKVVAVKDDRTVTADKLADAAIALLSKPENVNGQFFAWVHFVDPHTEYVRHEGFDFGTGSRDEYDSEVAFVDHHVGRIISHIQKSAFAERTAIIFTSDHGEAFGEHGMIRHGFELWEVLIRVPLVVHVPGAEPRRIAERRSIIDLAPTILDIFKLPMPSGEGDDFMSGKSLIYDVFMPPGYSPEKRIVFVDMAAGPNNADRQAFIENDYKLVTSMSRPLGLYHLKADPEERKDLLDDKELAGGITDRFKAFKRTLREVKVRPTE